MRATTQNARCFSVLSFRGASLPSILSSCPQEVSILLGVSDDQFCDLPYCRTEIPKNPKFTREISLCFEGIIQKIPIKTKKHLVKLKKTKSCAHTPPEILLVLPGVFWFLLEFAIKAQGVFWRLHFGSAVLPGDFDSYQKKTAIFLEALNVKFTIYRTVAHRNQKNTQNRCLLIRSLVVLYPELKNIPKALDTSLKSWKKNTYWFWGCTPDYWFFWKF